MENEKLKSYAHAMEIDKSTDKPMPKVAVRQTGSFFRLSSEEKPTVVDDGVQDGDDLLIVDTGDVHIFYKGVWHLQ